jgi:CobQ-like glutamine amidotransferase family enzyme/UDP-N-acetylmuramyl tripeptide synthase
LRAGGGSTVGGRLGLLVAPDLLRSLATGRAIALVSGTNGKTTTTRLLAYALGGPAQVATSLAGANMPAGLVAALAAQRGTPGVLEVDERHLAAVADSVTPAVIVLLNLSRDQLDRVGEVQMTASRWRAALSDSDATVVANADDPLVVFAAEGAARVAYVGTGTSWHADAGHCPHCQGSITFTRHEQDGPPGWSCGSCGFARPAPVAWLDGSALRTAGGDSFPIDLALPGRFNHANAVMAAVAADALGVRIEDALAAMSSLREVEGRFSLVGTAARPVRLLLAKNPAGFTEILDLVRGGDGAIVIGINSRIADGHDPSWLWDVPFERLAGHLVVATGERWRDLSVRLVHADIAHRCEPDQLRALAVGGGATVDYLGNYTAFQALRRRLPKHTPPPPSAGGARSDAAATAAGATVARRRGGEDGVAALRVVVVHPDLLGTYGDSGNGLVLANRARWRGIAVDLVYAHSDDPLPSSADLYVLGGGEDGPQARAVERLGDGALQRAIDNGAVVLAVCAGFQILGTSFPAADGHALRGLGVLDVATVRGEPRAVGELLVAPAADGKLQAPAELLTGFENHAGRTRRADGVAALGAVGLGIGNGDGSDGAVVGRVHGTYLHGPVLARNPGLADHLLGLALGAAMQPMPDDEERALHAERVAAATAASRRPGPIGTLRRRPVVSPG